ncbi:MAG: hypothetical protein F4063_02510 [Chloroflexi bacterium]|nr:hypothetical protein [Chloroflexota bacterium]
MVRFVAGDLSAAARRRVARYIDECPDCYREYMRHRAFDQKLSHGLPALGRPSKRQLDGMWLALQSELSAPEKPAKSISDFARRSSLSFSSGVIALAICLAALLPITLGYHASVANVEMRPGPQLVSVSRMPTAGNFNRSAWLAVTPPPANASHPQLQNTPEPR